MPAKIFPLRGLMARFPRQPRSCIRGKRNDGFVGCNETHDPQRRANGSRSSRPLLGDSSWRAAWRLVPQRAMERRRPDSRKLPFAGNAVAERRGANALERARQRRDGHLQHERGAHGRHRADGALLRRTRAAAALPRGHDLDDSRVRARTPAFPREASRAAAEHCRPARLGAAGGGGLYPLRARRGVSLRTQFPPGAYAR